MSSGIVIGWRLEIELCFIFNVGLPSAGLFNHTFTRRVILAHSWCKKAPLHRLACQTIEQQ
jgi:hypothetical protein